MRESSFADPGQATNEAVRVASKNWSRPVRLAMLLLNTLPLCHVAVTVAGALWLEGLLVKMAVVVVGIYLAPPLVVRLLLALRPLQAGAYPLEAPEFLRWWAAAQAQILFCRFSGFEELLRLVPGLYSAWLRLWGARIGRLTYWAPEVRILDRSLLEIGDDVVFGVGVRLNPHVIAHGEGGRPRLHIGAVRIGDGCHIGGYSLLTAGTVIERGQALKAFSLSPPFTTWREGRRGKPAIPK